MYSNIELLKRASESVTQDKGFELPSVPASVVLSTASKLTEWISKQENESAVNAFSEELVECLKGCLLHITGSQEGENVEKFSHLTHIRLIKNPLAEIFLSQPMWTLYYINVWVIFWRSLSLSIQQVEQPTVSALTYEETNALRYVAGYVCNKLKKKIERSKHPSL